MRAGVNGFRMGEVRKWRGGGRGTINFLLCSLRGGRASVFLSFWYFSTVGASGRWKDKREIHTNSRVAFNAFVFLHFSHCTGKLRNGEINVAKACEQRGRKGERRAKNHRKCTRQHKQRARVNW